MSPRPSKIQSLDLRKQRPVNSGGHFPVQRTGAGNKGTLSNWRVARNSVFSAMLERRAADDRAEDLAANDPHAAGLTDSMKHNIVGTGIMPQAAPKADILNIPDELAASIRTQAEWAFKLWSKEADAAGRLHFWQMQSLSIQTLLTRGEFLRLPVMLPEQGRTFSLALQCVSPARLATPTDLIGEPSVSDGVVLGRRGNPTGYWISNAKNPFMTGGYGYPSNQCRRIPAKIGHRIGCFHIFIQKEEEQVRGVSILAPAMKFFRDLSDYLDFELVGAIVASSFPVFVETPEAWAARDDNAVTDGSNQYQEVDPGQIMYGRPGERPHVLESNRPGNTFEAFVERILRAVGASCGIPYEIVAKDFSKTNYSSARAALLEAWLVFKFYQKWLVDSFLQPCWEMVFEEAYLRGMITLPKSAPDFYLNRYAYTNARWIPPRRGHVDPVKEMKALISGIDANLITMAEAVEEMGGDWEDTIRQRAREKELIQATQPEPAPADEPEKKDADNGPENNET